MFDRRLLVPLAVLFYQFATAGEASKVAAAVPKLNRQPSAHCIFDINVKQTFDHVLTPEERDAWVMNACTDKGRELALKCQLGVDPRELSRNCFGEPRLVELDETAPLLEKGPASISETKTVSGDARSESDAQNKLKKEIDQVTKDFTERFKTFAATCEGLGGVAFANVDTSQPLPRPAQEVSKGFPYSAVLKIRASCHQKQNPNEFIYSTDLSVRFWK
jgi:hypothetical protein